HRRRGNVGLLEQLQQWLAVVSSDGVAHAPLELRAMLHALDVRGEPGIVGHVAEAERAGQAPPEPGVRTGHGHPPVVATAEVAQGRQRGRRGPERLGHGPREQDALGLEVQQPERGFEQRAIDALSPPRPLAQSQRPEHTERAQDAGRQVEEGDAAAHGRAAGLAGNRHDPAERLHERLIAGSFGPRPCATERRDRAVDEARILARERVVPQTEFLHRPGPKVFDEDVRRGRKTTNERHTLGRLEVDRDAALVAIVDEIARGLAVLVRRPRARFIADARVFDLDDVGAEVAEQRTAVGTGQYAGKIYDTDAIESERDGGRRHDRPNILAGEAQGSRSAQAARTRLFRPAEGEARIRPPVSRLSLAGSPLGLFRSAVAGFGHWLAALALRRPDTIQRWLDCCAVAGSMWGTWRGLAGRRLRRVAPSHLTSAD